ncbi:uncharacterized protein N7479_010739 [Penicillium vulpinum]|uniref:GST N-terminal domain-containing protein n=1 Tax=Penicillium vulpinum TaxID=29845 RepID=A0A1V6S9J2_9EURO|nr:uncharacterized protein N7479_010739 [Penicillium vulpinum]KAJ5952326.1 hypothetical protein N7479_010739 [Penicillium vulpinum]OQE10409.1 hypothetical protein PENVUL_c004G01418 [Penicillium vulpinum]
MAAGTPKIKLYTHPLSPWSHRVHIALDALEVPYEQEIVDITKPRTPEYLEVNPRGLVPALSYDGKILTESTVIATFLADTFPSKLLPPSTNPNGPLTRAKISFFVDTYLNRVQPFFMKAQRSKSAEDRASGLAEFVSAAAKELDPLLSDAAPFFGGSSEPTLAEVLTGSFIIRAYILPKHGLLPETLLSDLAAQAPNFDKWANELITHPSVNGGIWDEEKIVANIRRRLSGQA